MWEVVSAVATALTGIIILVTVILGSHQLRLTNEQLKQLRRATQLEGTMRIFEVLRGPQFADALHFVSTEFVERMKDDGSVARPSPRVSTSPCTRSASCCGPTKRSVPTCGMAS